MIDYQSWSGARSEGTLWRVIADNTRHRILPDAVMDLVWCDGQFFAAGPDTVATYVTVPAGVATWGLRLRPGVAHALLGVPADALRGQRVPLDDLLRPPSAIVDAAHINPGSALLTLARTLTTHSSVDDAELRLAASLDDAARQGLTASATARAHNLSDRSLRRVSHRLFGYGPKTLQSIHRFQHALRLMQTGTPLAATAARAGYADQSHLAREVKRLAGTTLTVLRGP